MSLTSFGSVTPLILRWLDGRLCLKGHAGRTAEGTVAFFSFSLLRHVNDNEHDTVMAIVVIMVTDTQSSLFFQKKNQKKTITSYF